MSTYVYLRLGMDWARLSGTGDPRMVGPKPSVGCKGGEIPLWLGCWLF